MANTRTPSKTRSEAAKAAWRRRQEREGDPPVNFLERLDDQLAVEAERLALERNQIMTARAVLRLDRALR